VYVVSPMRNYHLDIGRKYELIDQHWDKVESILNKHNMHFINMHKMLSLEDRFFADGIHLNEVGAELFTRKLIMQMNEREIFKKINESIVYND